MSPSFIDRVGEGADERTPFDILLGEVHHVLGEWRRLVDPEALGTLPPSRLMNSMPEILPRLVRLARAGAVQVDEDLKERIADDHGIPRRVDDVPIGAVAEEWSSLKRACRTVLARNGIADASAETALVRLDLLIDDAVGYTLRGYYRDELDTLKGRGLERRDGREDRRRAGDRRDRTNGGENHEV